MNEIYTFTAWIVERWRNNVQLLPDDPAALLAYRERAKLTFDPFWHGRDIWVSVGSRRLVAQSEGLERVRYSVTRRGKRMFGVALEPA